MTVACPICLVEVKYRYLEHHVQWHKTMTNLPHPLMKDKHERTQADLLPPLQEGEPST